MQTRQEIIQFCHLFQDVYFKLVSLCRKGDIVVTQDYGVAAMILGKGAYGIHQSGKWYTNENIDQMLMERHLAKKTRNANKKHPLRGLAKRTEEDDKRFEVFLNKLIEMFDQLVSSTVRRCKRTIRDDNSSLILVLPYMTAEYRNNEQAFHEYYDEIEICPESAEKHYKSAHQVRNRSMVDRSDLVIFCVEHNSGGAYQTMQYAKKAGAKIVNLSDVPR